MYISVEILWLSACDNFHVKASISIRKETSYTLKYYSLVTGLRFSNNPIKISYNYSRHDPGLKLDFELLFSIAVKLIIWLTGLISFEWTMKHLQQRPSVSLFEYFEIPFEIFKKYKLLTLQSTTPQNGQNHSICQRIVWVCLTILWRLRLKD